MGNLPLTGQSVIGLSDCYWAVSHWSVCLLLVKKPVIGQDLLYLMMIWRKGINAVHVFVCLFQGWTKEKIKLQLENSYLLDSDDIDVFTVDSSMSDVVLINGVYFTTSTFTACNHQKVKLMLGIDQKTGIYKIRVIHSIGSNFFLELLVPK